MNKVFFLYMLSQGLLLDRISIVVANLLSHIPCSLHLFISGGAKGYIIARPILYNILYSRVPKEKILHSKRVMTMKNGERGVRVECNDGSFYEGDILVGADGAYSPVRQGMYRLLRRDNKLPSSDDKPLPYNVVCLVGQTTPLDPEEFPSLQEELCHFNNMESISVPYQVRLMLHHKETTK